MRRRKLHFNWWLVGLLCLTSMLDYQHVVSWGDTLHIPSNWNIKYRFFSIKKNTNVVVYSNIHDKFASTNLTCNLQNNREKKNFKTYITQFSFY